MFQCEGFMLDTSYLLSVYRSVITTGPSAEREEIHEEPGEFGRLLFGHIRNRGLGTGHNLASRNRDRLFRLCHSRRADRKSTRLNSSHLGISYAVFCLKKKTR